MTQPVPILDWDDTSSFKDDCVWKNRLDGRYQIEVHRTGSHTAMFYMWDHDNDMALVEQAEVGLSYEAMFGPDVADVNDWQNMAIEVADRAP